MKKNNARSNYEAAIIHECERIDTDKLLGKDYTIRVRHIAEIEKRNEKYLKCSFFSLLNFFLVNFSRYNIQDFFNITLDEFTSRYFFNDSLSMIPNSYYTRIFEVLLVSARLCNIYMFVLVFYEY